MHPEHSTLAIRLLGEGADGPAIRQAFIRAALTRTGSVAAAAELLGLDARVVEHWARVYNLPGAPRMAEAGR